MSKKIYKGTALSERKIELLISKEIDLVNDFKGTRPRWQRKKGKLLKRMLRTKDERRKLVYKLNREEGILNSQVNVD